jgi:hypothetical protein
LYSYYISLARRDKYSPAGFDIFLDDFYHNKTNPELVAYFKSGDKDFHIFKNDAFRKNKFIALEKNNGRWKAVDPGTCLKEYIHALKAVIQTTENDKVVFAWAKPYWKGDKYFTIFIGKEEYNIPADAFTRYVTGESTRVPVEISNMLQSIPALKDIIFLRDPILQKARGIVENNYILRELYGTNSQSINPASLILKLQQASADNIRFFLASDITTATVNYYKPPVQFDNFAIGNPGAKYKVDDFKLMSVLYSRLDKTKFIQPGDVMTLTPELFITVGHKNDQYLKYYEALINAGLLQDKFIFNYSCYIKDDDAWASAVLKKSKATCMAYYYTRIKPDAVRKVMLRYFMKAGQQGYDTGDITSVLRKVIRECADDPANKALKADIEALLDTIIWLLSKNDHLLVINNRPVYG